MFQTQSLFGSTGLLPGLSQSQSLFPVQPLYGSDNDINVNFCPIPGPPGPAGPPGPQGPPGSLSDVPVTLIDEATYAPNADEYFLGVIFNGQVTITLPPGTLGKVYIVKDSVGDAQANPITIAGSIDGLTSYVINVDWASATLVYNGIEWNIV